MDSATASRRRSASSTRRTGRRTSRSRSTKPKFRYFHVLGSSNCPWCTMIKGCIMMHLHSTSPAVYDRKVCYHDRDTQEGQRSWQEEAASAVPKSHTTIPCVVAEFSDGSLMYIGGVDKFVKKLGCPMKD